MWPTVKDQTPQSFSPKSPNPPKLTFLVRPWPPGRQPFLKHLQSNLGNQLRTQTEGPCLSRGHGDLNFLHSTAPSSHSTESSFFTHKGTAVAPWPQDTLRQWAACLLGAEFSLCHIPSIWESGSWGYQSLPRERAHTGPSRSLSSLSRLSHLTPFLISPKPFSSPTVPILSKNPTHHTVNTTVGNCEQKAQ